MEIIEFLEARIAEDEARARDFEHALALSMNGDYGNYEAVHGASAQWSTLGRIGFAPARVLAECAAKRAIIELAHEVDGMDSQIENEWGDFNGTADRILHALAAVYKDHPDYRQGWTA